jgi:thymidylate synthase
MRMDTVVDIRQHFIDELKDEAFTIDKTGQKTIELIGASFLATENSIFGEPNADYIDAEINWYLSGSTNIFDIYVDRDPPKAWEYSANRHGEINSNYGHLIFSDIYYRQYDNVLTELLENPDSRRAAMIYNRPSIWTEFNENSKNDFICTNAVTYYIRNNKLQSVVQMRSNDVVFGYKNDYAWQQYVLKTLARDLGIKPGFIHWQVQNLHVYERHFHLVK